MNLSKDEFESILNLEVGEDFQDSTGTVWARFPSTDGNMEYKISTNGHNNDYDTGSSWVPKKELQEIFDIGQREAQLHKTPNCSRPLYGIRLKAGDTLQATDMYDSTGGDWAPCPVPGLKLGHLGSDSVVWVRPIITNKE